MEWPVNATPQQVFEWAVKHFAYHSDIEVWGMPEFWATPEDLNADAAKNGGVVYGDCDDFAGLCVHALRANGHPARYVTVATEVCPSDTPFDHCVAESNGLLFDCRYLQGLQSVDDLEVVGYRFIEMSGLQPGDPWTEVAVAG
ncbi:MAG: hypothetical protein HY255_03650 [Betaproteobacteria bacterium]|nr:hypothetical protein [Betaproteobacteria bacterium]